MVERIGKMASHGGAGAAAAAANPMIFFSLSKRRRRRNRREGRVHVQHFWELNIFFFNSLGGYRVVVVIVVVVFGIRNRDILKTSCSAYSSAMILVGVDNRSC